MNWLEDHRHHHNWWLRGHDTAEANILLCFGDSSARYRISVSVNGKERFAEKYTIEDAKLEAHRLIRVLEGKRWAMKECEK